MKYEKGASKGKWSQEEKFKYLAFFDALLDKNIFSKRKKFLFLYLGWTWFLKWCQSTCKLGICSNVGLIIKKWLKNLEASGTLSLKSKLIPLHFSMRPFSKRIAQKSKQSINNINRKGLFIDRMTKTSLRIPFKMIKT